MGVVQNGSGPAIEWLFLIHDRSGQSGRKVEPGAVTIIVTVVEAQAVAAACNNRNLGLQTMPAIDWQHALAQHDRWLRTVVLARVGQASAVEEVMQEVALAAVRQQAPLA